MSTPYETIGVPPDASADDIKRAYRKGMAKAHPDREGGDASRAVALNDAYRIIGDEAMRRQYDATGSTATEEQRRSHLAADLQGAFMQIVQNSPETVDVMAAIAHGLRESIRMHEHTISELALLERKTKRALDRLIFKGNGENLFAAGLRNALRNVDMERERNKVGIENRNMQLAMLKDYEYRPEAPPSGDDGHKRWREQFMGDFGFIEEPAPPKRRR